MIIDRTQLDLTLELLESREAFTLFLEEFKDETTKAFNLAQEAARQGDAEGVRRVMHRLKPSFEALGAVKVAELSLQLEKQAEGGSLSHAGSLLMEIEASYAQSITVLEEIGLTF